MYVVSDIRARVSGEVTDGVGEGEGAGDSSSRDPWASDPPEDEYHSLSALVGDTPGFSLECDMALAVRRLVDLS